MMKKFVSAIAICALATGLATPAMAGVQDFTVVNRTGYEIYSLYVSPSDERSWEEDVLDDDVLPDGDSVRVNFDNSEDDCMWDIMVVYSIDDEHVYWNDIDLCEVSTVQLQYDSGSGRSWATTD